MSTKVKVGIAAVIVTALVGLIVLDQKTTPKEEPTSAVPGPAGTGDGTAGGTAQPSADEAYHLFKGIHEAFRAEGTSPAGPAPIKGVESPAIKDLRPQTDAPADEYVVQPGDTYSDIAGKKYGDRNLWEVIAKANPSIKPTHLRPGKKIVIPARPEAKTSAPAEPAPAESPRMETAPASDANLPTVYVVQTGDTLSGISKKLYNTVRNAEKIYEANRDKLDSPHDLRVGMKLSLPQDASRRDGVASATASPDMVAGTTASSAPATAGGKTHKVQPSESLWKIAEAYCGDRGILDMIEAIVKANPDKLKDNRALLRVGWDLVIPE